jgi:hypothetical protein
MTFAVWSGLNVLTGMLMLFAALLRETPAFWRNAGGFPLLLREVVLLLFYPGLLVLAIGVLLSTAIAWRWRQNSRLLPSVWLAGAVQWLLFLAVLLIFAWNNLVNLFESAPLHQHLP